MEWIEALAGKELIFSTTENFAGVCLSQAELPVPFPDSYWVVPGRLLAGEYPGSKDPVATERKVGKLLDAGVNCIVDLTEEGELEPYKAAVERPGADCCIIRSGIEDFSVPSVEQMTALLDTVDSNLFSGKTVYVHCWGGHGRTGTAIGCWLKRHGIGSNETVFTRIRELRAEMDDASVDSPETEEQRLFVENWREER